MDSNIWIYVLIIFFIILLIGITVFLYVFYNTSNNENIENPYPDNSDSFYTKNEYLDSVPSLLDLNNLPELINNSMRSIAINERYKLGVQYLNLNEKYNILLNNKYIGTCLKTTDNDVIIFIDDYILDKDKLIYETLDYETIYGDIRILKQFNDDFDNIKSQLLIDDTVNNLYVYTRGCSTTLGILIWLNANNNGYKEFLYEGFPGLITDYHGILDLMTSTNRAVFVNNLNDPLISFTKTGEFYNGTHPENYVTFDQIRYDISISNNTLVGFQNHNILNYFE